MIKLIYKHVCDGCKDSITEEDWTTIPNAPMPQPNQYSRFNGMDLCPECAPIVREAINKAIKKCRLRK